MRKLLSVLIAVVMLAGSNALHAAFIQYAGGTYSQNFNTLAAAGANLAWGNDSTITGWNLFNRSGTAIATYDAGTGSGNTGSFYSFGAASAADRALGGVGAGTAYFGTPPAGAVAGYIAVAVQNVTGGTLSQFTVSFNGEQWRNSGNPSLAQQTMVLEYGFGTTFAAVSSWTTPGGNFDWASSVATATAGAVDGNAAGLVNNRGGTVTGLSWADTDTLWIRWIERNDSDNDHALAIDDFSITAVPEPTTWAGLIFGALFCGTQVIRRCCAGASRA